MFRIQIQIIIYFCLLVWASGGEVKLKDGSLLKGRIVKIHNETLTLETSYIGTLSIKMSDVEAVVTDDVVKIKKEEEIEEKKYDSKDDGLLLTLWADGMDPDIFRNKWLRKFWLDYNQKNGNSNERRYKGGFDISYIRERDTTKIYGKFDDKDKNEQKTSDDRQIGLDYERLMGPQKRHAWYVRSNWLKDKIDEIKLRSTYATGYGYYFIRDAGTTLRGRSGILYRHEDFYNDETDESTGFDFGVNLQTKIFESLSWYTDIEYSPTFEDFGDYIFLHESGFSVPLGVDIELNLKAGVEHEYTSEPAEDVDEMDTKYFLRLEFEF